MGRTNFWPDTGDLFPIQEWHNKMRYLRILLPDVQQLEITGICGGDSPGYWSLQLFRAHDHKKYVGSAEMPRVHIQNDYCLDHFVNFPLGEL